MKLLFFVICAVILQTSVCSLQSNSVETNWITVTMGVVTVSTVHSLCLPLWWLRLAMSHCPESFVSRLRLKCDGTRTETRFRLSAKRRVHLNRRGRQFRQLLAAEVCASAVVMLDTPCSEIVWRVMATHSIRQFSLHFPSRASPCSITFQQDCTNLRCVTSQKSEYYIL